METYRIINGYTIYPIDFYIMQNISIIQDMGQKLADFIGERKEFQSIPIIRLICRGSSGAIISAIVSSILIEKNGKQVVIHHVKKEGENSHGYNMLNYSIVKDSIFIIIDDFVDTGSTVQAMLDHIRTYTATPSLKPSILCVTGGGGENMFVNDFEYLICSK